MKKKYETQGKIEVTPIEKKKDQREKRECITYVQKIFEKVTHTDSRETKAGNPERKEGEKTRP